MTSILDSVKPLWSREHLFGEAFVSPILECSPCNSSEVPDQKRFEDEKHGADSTPIGGDWL